MGKRVTRADEIHLAVIMTGQHVELAGKKKEKDIGQHVGGKKNEWEANTLSWLVKIHMRSRQPMCNHRLKVFLNEYKFQV